MSIEQLPVKNVVSAGHFVRSAENRKRILRCARGRLMSLLIISIIQTNHNQLHAPTFPLGVVLLEFFPILLTGAGLRHSESKKCRFAARWKYSRASRLIWQFEGRCGDRIKQPSFDSIRK